ncbi:MAG: histidine phosphatase family protein, partial [Cyclobacteriaceae bacterium]|nr:histidine phosphatase family protein [Cyclobacteriaceae bacterium]
MKSKKIYLVRHGQTDYNLKGIVQGSGIDASINNTGRAQADNFFESYKDVLFDKVYTSALQRSIQSVDKFIKSGIPHKILTGLNEINWGNREGKVFTPVEDIYFQQVIEAWRLGDTALKIDGGESPEDVRDRQKIALREILSREEEETILICMHGRAMRIFLCLILNYPLSRMDEFEHH